jgi:hypothetical protein
MKPSIVFITLVLSAYCLATSAGVVDQLLDEYSGKTGIAFDAGQGRTLWTTTHTNNKASKARSCSTCHTENLAATGKHAKTRKPIEPLAPSVNSERLTDAKTIEKWFLRNCKWTLGRECTPEEKGHFLKFISSQ